MAIQFDEEVWVVALGDEPIAKGSSTRFVDMPDKHNVYIFPTRYNPRRTVFIAFRYHGQLHAVHKILRRNEKPEINYNQVIPGLNAPTRQKCTAYHLGPAIPLQNRPRTGKRLPWNTQAYCDLDLLLTSKTISDAKRLTDERKAKQPLG